MEERPFTNPTIKPGENELHKILGCSAAYYLEIKLQTRKKILKDMQCFLRLVKRGLLVVSKYF